MTDDFYPNEEGPSEVMTRPSNREAEEALIGAVLINKDVYFQVAQFLSADDFFIVRNKWIWEAFRHMSETRDDFDIVTLSETLSNRGQLEEVGGQGYLMTLINRAPNAFHAESYGRIIEQNAIRRRMLDAANEIARLAYKQDQSIDAVVDEAERQIFNVSERRIEKDIKPISEVASEYYSRIDELANRPEDIGGVPAGLIDIDNCWAVYNDQT